jgi:hypothetical protein
VQHRWLARQNRINWLLSDEHGGAYPPAPEQRTTLFLTIRGTIKSSPPTRSVETVQWRRPLLLTEHATNLL